jgi:hypothetical protein
MRSRCVGLSHGSGSCQCMSVSSLSLSVSSRVSFVCLFVCALWQGLCDKRLAVLCFLIKIHVRDRYRYRFPYRFPYRFRYHFRLSSWIGDWRLAVATRLIGGRSGEIARSRGLAVGFLDGLAVGFLEFVGVAVF